MVWVVACLLASPARADEPWTPLFNGKDLAGWTPKIRGEAFGEDKDKTFRVEDGVIRVGYENYKEFGERFGHLFYKEPFSKYRLRIEYRFVGDQCKGGPGWATRNSGVMLHCQDPATMTKDQDFPVSIEAQFLGGLGKGKRSTSNVCTPGTHIVLNGKLHKTHCQDSKSKTYDGDQWVTVEFEVHGAGKIRHLIDGEVVLEYEQPQLDPTDANAKPLIKGDDLLIEGGYISLQSESHPIEFRKVEIQPISE
jgi:hypothetical protein